MKEILITSSVLIIVLLILRAVFANKVRRTLIYGTWLLVALRLLIPVQFGELSISVLNLFQPVTQTITDISDKQVAGITEQDAHHQVMQEYIEQDHTVFVPEVQEQIQSALDSEMPKEEIVTIIDKEYPEDIYVPEVRPQVQKKVEKATDPITLGQILWSVWGIGAVAAAIWLSVSNLRFVRGMKQTATAISLESPLPVYVTERAVSPCLVGLFRPAVYLTPEVAGNENLLRYVMTHELTHYAHRDHIWSIVRCLCLCLHWFNPLVWIAAWCSRRDCELACDEGAMARLGEEQRIDYGKALLAVVQEASVPSRLMLTATAMAETKQQLRQRVHFIARKPHLSLFAAIALVLVCALVVGCVATGAKPQTAAEEPSIEAPAITEPTESVTPTESVAPTDFSAPSENTVSTESTEIADPVATTEPTEGTQLGSTPTRKPTTAATQPSWQLSSTPKKPTATTTPAATTGKPIRPTVHTIPVKPATLPATATPTNPITRPATTLAVVVPAVTTVMPTAPATEPSSSPETTGKPIWPSLHIPPIRPTKSPATTLPVVNSATSSVTTVPTTVPTAPSATTVPTNTKTLPTYCIVPTYPITAPTVPINNGKVLEIYGLGHTTSYTDYSQFDASSYNWMMRAAAEEWAALNGYTLIFKGAYDQNVLIAELNSGDNNCDIIFHGNAFPQIANYGIAAPFTAAEYQKLANICGGSGYLDLLSYNKGAYGFVLPWADNVVCYYNATLFEKFGLKSPKEYFLEGNWNWDTFMHCMEMTTADTNADGITDVYGLTGASWENLVNPWATNAKGQLISTINEPWMKAFFQLKYDAYSVKKVTKNYKNNLQTNVISPLFAMQLAECQVYDFQQLYPTIPNGNKVEVVPVPAYEGNNILQFEQACASLAVTCDQREAAVDLLAYILQCGMKYMSDYSLGAVECDYEGIQGTCQQSQWYLNAFQKTLKDRAKALKQVDNYDEKLIAKMYESFANAQWYTKLSVPGVTALTDFTEITDLPPESAIPSVKPKYQAMLDRYNNVYVR